MKLNKQAYEYVRTTTNSKISKQMRNERRNAKTNKCANECEKHGREYTWVKNRVTLEKKLSNPDVRLKKIEICQREQGCTCRETREEQTREERWNSEFSN